MKTYRNWFVIMTKIIRYLQFNLLLIILIYQNWFFIYFFNFTLYNYYNIFKIKVRFLITKSSWRLKFHSIRLINLYHNHMNCSKIIDKLILFIFHLESHYVINCRSQSIKTRSYVLILSLLNMINLMIFLLQSF